MFAWRDNYISYNGGGAAPTPSGDPYWTSVSFRQDFETPQTAFADDSTNKSFVSLNTGTPRTTSLSPFGSASGSIFFPNANSIVAATSNNNAYAFGTGDFTVECWFYRTTASNAAAIAGAWTGSVPTSSWLLTQGNNNTSNIRWGDCDGTNLAFIESSACLLTNAWQHIAIVRQSSVLKIYHNGTQVYSAANTRNISLSPTMGIMGVIGSSFTSTGYISNLRVVKGTAVYTAAFTPPTSPLTAITNTSFLLTGSKPSVISDTGPNAYSIATTGTITYSGLNPFSTVVANTYPGSIYFNGSSGTLSAATSGNLVNTDFTWECWARFNVLTGAPCLMAVSVNSTTRTLLYFDPTNGIRYAVARGADQVSIQQGSTSGWSINTWYHIALVRSGNNYVIYRNGVSVATGTNSYAQSNETAGFTLGYSNASGSFLYMNGFISNARVVNGTAVYTGAFTPPTSPLTAITNTRFLPSAINPTPDPGMFNNSITVDLSNTNATVTMVSSPTYSGLSPFFTSAPNIYPGSIRFNSGQCVTTTSPTNVPTGTGAYTVEGWIRFSSITTNQSQAFITGFGNNTFFFGMGRSYNGDVNGLRIGKANVADCENCAFTFTTNTWYHVAVVRSGTTIYFFVNGVQQTTVAGSGGSTGSFLFSTGTGIRLGGGGTSGSIAEQFLGNMSNWRVVVGTALYTSNFTPSTTPLTNITNTTALFTLQNSGFYDISDKGQSIAALGAALQTTRALSKFGTQSSYYLANVFQTVTNPSDNSLTFSSQDFTIEFWIYRTVGGTSQTIMAKGTTGTYWTISINTSNQLVWIVGGLTVGTGTTTPMTSTSTWYFIALSRVSDVFYMFVNGVSQGSYSTVVNISGSNNLIIGADGSGTTGFNGYIDDVRITKGVGRYTTTCTVPTEAFPNS